MGLGVVIPAAGSGNRMGAEKNKLLLKVNDQTIIEYTVRFFASLKEIDEIILVVKQKEEDIFAHMFRNIDKVTYVEGGKDRKDSVRNGVKALSDCIDKVLVHDGARPLIDYHTVLRVIEGLEEHEAVIPCIPVKDTIKVVDENIVDTTLVRSNLVAVQTPQGFNKAYLNNVYQDNRIDEWIVTDEASLVENYGGVVKVVLGNELNFKVTTPIDLRFMKVVLEDVKCE